ncbi:PREDICTED: uncharacterized protein LOC109581421 [Amphimedon queenslandica]|uniref:Helicase ATP-binding domain-containing protein n=1 Tax=Amphimedon queenslandica TaxID=400682 RepID=A0AAN0J209_AMPQE|nr:PREDICTED: uncharacterized protein LOC109581421 [Amphimedon queenslandica]|eukprot:XP_019851079.1 PREDICTED: uncharacterized protein LOC109581421 [Amphimedon queenslandica]
MEKVCLSLGYSELRSLQKDAMKSFVAARDVFVSLPTRFGKSLIYGCLPLLFDKLRCKLIPSSIVIVICPLVALMKDQVEKFQSLGMRSAYVGDQSLDSAAFLTGDIKLIFISQESLNRGSLWRDVVCSDVYQQNVVAFVIDEAHLVKNWGINFSPDFSCLSEI